MPTYLFSCEAGHHFDRYLKFADYDQPQTCECGKPAVRQICAPMFAFVQRDICYDSPIDGRPITTKQARVEDMKRAGCVEYDPEMKTDYKRRLADQEKAIDKHVEETVEREIHSMPSRKREKLTAELQAGVNADVARITPPQRSFKEA